MCLTLILWKPLISRDAATVELELPEVAMGPVGWLMTGNG